MPWRLWGQGAGRPTVVLCHGGSGSWTHWLRNVLPLSEQFNVVVPDLPGLGDAAALPPGYSAADAARCVIDAIVGPGFAPPVPRPRGPDGEERSATGLIAGGNALHLVAFSWGCTVASMAARELGDRVASLLLVGPAAVGALPRRTAMQPLIRREPGMSDQAIWDINAENLARLMFHDRKQIDDVAIYTQVENTRRARFYSPQFATTSLVLEALTDVHVPVQVLYGESDAPAFGHIPERRERLLEACPQLKLDTVSAGGHWLQYELARDFNRRCKTWIESQAHVL